MSRRIPHGDNPVEVRKAFQHLAAHTDVITTGPVGAVLIGAGSGVVPTWSTSLTTLTLLTVDNITINGAVISSDTGAISFSDENLTTTGTISGVNVTSGADPGHTHTGASLSGIDISADTNLAVTAPIVLTDDTLSLNQAGIDHGAIGGLGDDDHTIYLLADGARDLTGNLTVLAGITIDGRDLSVDGGNLDTLVTNAGKVGVDSGATVDYLGAAGNDGALRASTGISYADGGNFVTLTTNDGQIVHDNLSGYDANEHVDHTGVSISTGSGLTGGGDISTTRTLTLDINGLDADTIVAADAIPFYDATGTHNNKATFANFEAALNHNSLINYESDRHIAHSVVSITGGSGISGGGDITLTRTLALDFNKLDAATIVSGDFVAFWDITATAICKKITFSDFITAMGPVGTDILVAVDSGATAGYLGVAAGDGVLRTNAQITWVDGGDFVTLSCNPGYVDRGDPASFDFTGIAPGGDFTCDTTYYDLDLSGIIPAGAYAVQIKLEFRATAAGDYMRFRTKGNSNNVNTFRPTITSANTYVNYEGVVAVDANREIQYSGTANIDLIYCLIKGWYI